MFAMPQNCHSPTGFAPPLARHRETQSVVAIQKIKKAFYFGWINGMDAHFLKRHQSTKVVVAYEHSTRKGHISVIRSCAVNIRFAATAISKSLFSRWL
jgi:hypothetical protein